MRYIYLHGFASSPQSAKAKYLRDRFRSRQLDLICPDLNQPDFFNLTLTRQIQQVEQLVFQHSDPVVLLGSSLGGLTATWVAERQPQVEQLILLAPAFEFLAHWLPLLGSEQIQQWHQRGYRSVFHYGYQQEHDLAYTFLLDCQQYADPHLRRSLPTTIVHGCQDEVIPVEASRNFAGDRPWVKLIELESDHSLGNAVAQIWRIIQTQLGFR